MPSPYENNIDNPASRIRKQREAIAKQRQQRPKPSVSGPRQKSEAAAWNEETRRGARLVSSPRLFETMDIDPDDPIQNLLYETGIEKPPREFGVVDVEQRFKFRRGELAERVLKTWRNGVIRAEDINRDRLNKGLGPIDFGIKYDSKGNPIPPKLTRRELARMEKDYTRTGNPVETKYLYADGSVRVLADQTVNIDHVVPLDKGGSNTIKNMLPLYGSDNMAIGGKTKTEARYSARPIVTPWYMQAMAGLPDEASLFSGQVFNEPTRAFNDLPSEQARKVGQSGRLSGNLWRWTGKVR